jgi:hypothetical protein
MYLTDLKSSFIRTKIQDSLDSKLKNNNNLKKSFPNKKKLKKEYLMIIIIINSIS